jgi:hypothetical protein
MKKLIQFIILSSISFHCLANKYTPKKVNNSDLRSNTVILSIEESLKDKNSDILTLHKSSSNHYFISKKNKALDSIHKISYKSAQALDSQFVAIFLDLKYMTKSFSGKNCSIFYSLSMRGETTNICESEKLKIKRLEKIVFMMNKYFK